MAKKRASRKPRGTDAGGQPLDLSNRGQYFDQVDRMFDARNSGSRAEQRVASRNVTDFQRNAPFPRSADYIRGVAHSKGPFSMGPAKSPISGRTVEFGTRSMLQGLRNWIAGGGGSRLTGR